MQRLLWYVAVLGREALMLKPNSRTGLETWVPPQTHQLLSRDCEDRQQ